MLKNCLTFFAKIDRLYIVLYSNKIYYSLGAIRMKQICSLFLILTMILSMFSGCSNEKSKESETVVAAEATEETTEPIVQEETSEI